MKRNGLFFHSSTSISFVCLQVWIQGKMSQLCIKSCSINQAFATSWRFLFHFLFSFATENQFELKLVRWNAIENSLYSLPKPNTYFRIIQAHGARLFYRTNKRWNQNKQRINHRLNYEQQLVAVLISVLLCVTWGFLYTYFCLRNVTMEIGVVSFGFGAFATHTECITILRLI